MKKKIEKDKMADFAPQMYSVLKELQESASYWSEYDVPLGIVDRINDVLKKVENNKKTDTIKTSLDLTHNINFAEKIKTKIIISAYFRLDKETIIQMLSCEKILIDTVYYEVPENQLLHFLINREFGDVKLNLVKIDD